MPSPPTPTEQHYDVPTTEELQNFFVMSMSSGTGAGASTELPEGVPPLQVSSQVPTTSVLQSVFEIDYDELDAIFGTSPPVFNPPEALWDEGLWDEGLNHFIEEFDDLIPPSSPRPVPANGEPELAVLPEQLGAAFLAVEFAPEELGQQQPGRRVQLGLKRQVEAISSSKPCITPERKNNKRKSFAKYERSVDKTIILYVATLLDSTDNHILSLCLDILENFLQNEKSHDTLITTFGMFEALESFSIRLRHSDCSQLAERATKMTDILRNSAPPAYSTRSRRKGNRSRKTTFVYLLHIEELTPENRIKLDETLVQTNGIVSFVVDQEQKRCTVRITSKLSIKNLVTKVKENCGLTSYLVSRKNDNEEMLINILKENSMASLYSEYFPEENSPPRTNAVQTTKNHSAKSPNNWIKAAADFLTNSFYW